jgi:hypothetical protein
LNKKFKITITIHKYVSRQLTTIILSKKHSTAFNADVYQSYPYEEREEEEPWHCTGCTQRVFMSNSLSLGPTAAIQLNNYNSGSSV